MSNSNHRALFVLAEQILTRAHTFDWTLQGMGMLRLHLPRQCRLHIWDSRYRVPNVSMIHDHLQWGLISTIIAGHLVNKKYREVAEHDVYRHGHDYIYTVLKPGEGCYFKEEPKPIQLIESEFQILTPGQSYRQRPNEIHETSALDGTVTFMEKDPQPEESARVFWKKGEEWVSAEPRKATPEEVHDIVSLALERWFK